MSDSPPPDILQIPEPCAPNENWVQNSYCRWKVWEAQKNVQAGWGILAESDGKQDAYPENRSQVGVQECRQSHQVGPRMAEILIQKGQIE